MRPRAVSIWAAQAIPALLFNSRRIGFNPLNPSSGEGAPWRLRRHDVEITENIFQSHLVSAVRPVPKRAVACAEAWGLEDCVLQIVPGAVDGVQ